MTERKSSFKRAFRNDVRHFTDILIIMIAWVVPLPKMPLPGRGTTQIIAPKVWKKTLVNHCLISPLSAKVAGSRLVPMLALGRTAAQMQGTHIHTHTHTHTDDKLQQTFIFP